MDAQVYKRDFVCEDREYQLIRFGALKSVGLAAKLGKQIGGGVSGYTGDNIAIAVLSSIDSDELPGLVKNLLSEVSHKGRKLDIDNHFLEYPDDLIPLLAFSIKENILPFLSGKALSMMAEVMVEWSETLQELQ